LQYSLQNAFIQQTSFQFCLLISPTRAGQRCFCLLGVIRRCSTVQLCECDLSCLQLAVLV